MGKILAVARYTFTEITRNKIIYVFLLFAAVVFSGSLLFAAMGGVARNRLLLDLGLAAIEAFSLIIAVFSAVTLVLEEVETRTISLVLTRPVRRVEYLLGRYAGLMAAVAAGMAAMAAIHLVIMAMNGWAFAPRYLLVVALTGVKVAVMVSLSMLFSLFSTSAASSVVFVVVFWILGHFGEELAFLRERIAAVPGAVLWVISRATPNLQYFNLRDQWDTLGPLSGWLAWAGLYGALYTAACLAVAAWLFSRKEFA